MHKMDRQLRELTEEYADAEIKSLKKALSDANTTISDQATNVAFHQKQNEIWQERYQSATDDAFRLGQDLIEAEGTVKRYRDKYPALMEERDKLQISVNYWRDKYKSALK